MLTQIVKGMGLATLAITAYLAWPAASLVIGLCCIAKGGNQLSGHGTGYGLCMIGALCCLATGLATTPGILLLSFSLSTSTFGISRWILPALFPRTPESIVTTPSTNTVLANIASPTQVAHHRGASFGYPPVDLKTIPPDLFSLPINWTNTTVTQIKTTHPS